MNDERLRQILRQGDPAAGEGLTLEEVRAMRRTVLTAVPDRRWGLLPLLALAGAVATAVLIAIFLLKPEPVRTPAPPRIAAAPATAARPPVQTVPQPPPQEAERRPIHKHRSPHHLRRPVAPAPPEVNDTLASLETADVERQVQFSTPGGTRIIWILKSGKASHESGR